MIIVIGRARAAHDYVRQQRIPRARIVTHSDQLHGLRGEDATIVYVFGAGDVLGPAGGRLVRILVEQGATEVRA